MVCTPVFLTPKSIFITFGYMISSLGSIMVDTHTATSFVQFSGLVSVIMRPKGTEIHTHMHIEPSIHAEITD